MDLYCLHGSVAGTNEGAVDEDVDAVEMVLGGGDAPAGRREGGE